MTQLSRTAMIPQLAISESPRIWHYGLRALYKHAQRVQFTAPRLRERSKSPRAALLSGHGSTPRHLWMPAGRKVPVTPTLSGKRSKEYIEALISQ